MALDVDQAELIGTAVQSVAFGIYLVLFAAAVLRLIIGAKSHKWKPNKVMLCGALSLFSLISAHMVIDQIRLAQVFLITQPTANWNLVSTQEHAFEWQRDKLNVLRNILLLLEIITMDILMVYRVYIIWEREWRSVLLPAAALLGTLITGIMGGVRLVEKPWPWDLIMDLKRSVIEPFSFSLATNVLAVALVSWRVVLRDRKLRGAKTRSLSKLITITVEAAGLYCVMNWITVLLLVTKPVTYFAVVHVVSPITGISCCLIQLRVRPRKSVALFDKNRPASSAPGAILGAPSSVHMHVHITREEEISVTESGESEKAIAEGDRFSPDQPDEQLSVV